MIYRDIIAKRKAERERGGGAGGPVERSGLIDESSSSVILIDPPSCNDGIEGERCWMCDM